MISELNENMLQDVPGMLQQEKRYQVWYLLASSGRLLGWWTV